jgi:hypothetical protein
MSDTEDIDDIAKRPTRPLEAGLLFGVAIDAIRAIKVHPRKGGQRHALVSVVFSVIALEPFVNEMTEHAQHMAVTQPACGG